MVNAIAGTRKTGLAIPIWLTFGTLFFLASHARAAWVADGKFSVSSLYDDNVTLSSTQKDDSFITLANGQVELSRMTENSETSGIAGVNYISYSASQAGGSDLPDKDIEYVDLRSRVRGERSSFGFRGSVRRDVTLRTVGVIRDPLAPGGSTTDASAPPGSATTAGSTTGGTSGSSTSETGSTSGTVGAGTTGSTDAGGEPLGGGGGVDAGSVEEQIRRYVVRLNPYADYELSERLTGSVGFFYQGLRYEHGSNAGLENSETAGVNLQLTRRVTERDSARIALGAAQFNPEQAPTADSYQATVGWDHEFSPEARISVDAGASYRDQKDQQGDTGFVFRLRAYRNSETGNMFFDAQRSLYPNGFGDLAETDRLDFGIARNLSRTVQITARGYGYRISGVTNDRDYIRIGPELTWSFTRELSIGANYLYEWVDRKGDPGNGASGNTVGIFITYQPRRPL